MIIQPNWPAPKNIKACTTLCKNETNSFFNLADHVKDSHENVIKNREFLKKSLSLKDEPIWIQQTHSTIVKNATPENRYTEADASFTHEKNHICVVLTADCLPILVTDKKGTQVAAIHAGWRGLANGIIENTLQKLTAPWTELLVWIGPGICQNHYETGHEVREKFLENNPQAHLAFTPSTQGKWMADLFELARIRLQALGVTEIFGGEFCTFEEKDLFFSYRREGEAAGRIATLIWIE